MPGSGIVIGISHLATVAPGPPPMTYMRLLALVAALLAAPAQGFAPAWVPGAARPTLARAAADAASPDAAADADAVSPSSDAWSDGAWVARESLADEATTAPPKAPRTTMRKFGEVPARSANAERDLKASEHTDFELYREMRKELGEADFARIFGSPRVGKF